MMKKHFSIRKAENFFRIAITRTPGLAQNYINFSALLIETGRPHVALSYLNRAKDLTLTHSERAEWFNNKAMALFRLGKHKEALCLFKRAVDAAPDEERFWGNLGSACGAVGDYKGSVNYLRKGLRRLPDSPRLRLVLAMSYINMKQYENAIQTLEKLKCPEKEIKREAAHLMKSAREKKANGG